MTCVSSNKQVFNQMGKLRKLIFLKKLTGVHYLITRHFASLKMKSTRLKYAILGRAFHTASYGIFCILMKSFLKIKI
jgi:hypothetical protein